MLKKIFPFITAFFVFIFVLSITDSPYSSNLSTATITYKKGKVFTGLSKKGPFKAVTKGMTIAENSFIITEAKSRVELTFPDKSIIRLAPDTQLKLTRIYFPEKEGRLFSAKLFLGSMWAKVVHTIGKPRGTFNIQTVTAVAGVRGTVYDIRVFPDNTTIITVFEGSVGVKPPIMTEGGPKEEMDWPGQISEQKWEEIIVGQLQRLRIAPDGTPGKPEPIVPAKEIEEWTLWNQERDKKQN